MGSYEVSWLEHNILLVRLEDEYDDASVKRLADALLREGRRADGVYGSIVDARDLLNPESLATALMTETLATLQATGQKATSVVLPKRLVSTGRIPAVQADVRFHTDLVEAQAAVRRSLRAAAV